MKSILLFMSSILLTPISGWALYPPDSLKLSCEYLAPIEKSYFARHITHSKFNANFGKRVTEQFIKKIDPSELYLLKSDVQKIETLMDSAHKKIQAEKPDCTAIFQTHALVLKRAEERVEFAKTYLGKKFKFDKSTKLILDPEKRDFPKTKTEADDFHKKYLQFQIASHISTDMELKEAKETLIRSYERNLRRLKDVSREDLLSYYIDAFARSLDPHSSYFTADQIEDFQIQMGLSLEGIGATLSSRDGFTIIEALIPGGAASNSGELKPKDKIIAVAQDEKGKAENVIEQELRDVVKKIRGKAGTKVKLTILRKEGKSSKRFEVVLIRSKVKLEDEAAFVKYETRTIGNIKKTVALVNLPSFYAESGRRGPNARTSSNDLKKIFVEVRKKNVDAVVLDLSTNGGGSLDDAVKISGLFFGEGNVVKQSSNDIKIKEVPLADDDPRVDWNGPLVVLTSRISASASEIVAGTLKDYKRAVIVGGDHTFGKGSVQSVEPLTRGLGALKTTVGMFFTPGGSSTQHRGVDADVVMPSPYSSEEIGEKTLEYSLPPKKIAPFLSAEAYVPTGRNAWSLVDKKMIVELNKRSKVRVAKSEDFKKVNDNIKKAEARGKHIVISEFLEDKEESDKEEGIVEGKDKKSKSYAEQKDERMKKYMERADVQEALNIAADLAELMGVQKPITVGSQPPGPQKQETKN